ncbi:Photosynthetic NDH subunit of subcomplex B 5, chloroplastic [Stylosanthes scabra]|uniref:Photosynthetic NDH subunit of subcomplex B 5, chloroplastic n=1 Tax=Stylosanthes scabra TaxID=79078 RepID=A0ABU6W6E7_9FABA|nr:Photosynthetic NDH subunit of subcomplex B 5, chloroplastic [Stylosanthes scabra]
MALCSSLSSLSSLPPLSNNLTSSSSKSSSPNLHSIFTNTKTSSRRSRFLLNAGFAEIEPDLNEDPIDQFRTNGISPEEFQYGIYDDHHTFYEGEQHLKGVFWSAIAEEIAAAEPPTGFQGLISWLFPPAIAAAYYFNVPGEYIYIGAGIFTIIFCIIEMDKPDKPHHFEPQIYNMERGARDKLINDYNTMDIWDFNEKYGDLWDFTIKRDDTGR